MIDGGKGKIKDSIQLAEKEKPRAQGVLLNAPSESPCGCLSGGCRVI